MPLIPLPNKINQESIDKNTVKFTVEPCWSGYGTTLGNALRRVLLSSLSGAAVTKVKIKGVEHEFTTLEGVQDDIVHLIMNIKHIRLRSYSDEPVKVQLQAKGKSGKVTAGDIKTTADIEIMNPDFVITELTDKNKEINITMTVEKGLGYKPVESRNDESESEVGEINIDAFFSPVTNVGFDIEQARVGQDINYDRLILTVSTDGSISPQQAMHQAVTILIEHFDLLLENTKSEDEEESKKKKTKSKSRKKNSDGEDDK